MVQTRCPHCDRVVQSDGFPKGKTIACPGCARVFLPIVLSASEPAPEPPSSPPVGPPAVVPARPATAAPPKATRQMVVGPERVRVASCPKCRALLKMSEGSSRFGRCEACSHVFVFEATVASEMVLPAAEAQALPQLQLFDVPAEQEDDDDVGRTVMRTTARNAPSPRPETIRCMLMCDAPRVRHEIVSESTVIGRQSADITLSDPDVSRRHCSVERSGSKIMVRDLKSTNGTLVNGTRVELEVLKDGDRIRVGSTEFRLVITAEGEREKHAALLLEIGLGSMPADVRLCLDAFRAFVTEQMGDERADVILSPSVGRAMAIWRFDSVLPADERRRNVERLLTMPAAARAELATVPLASGTTAAPLLGLLVGMAKRDVIEGRVKFDGPLLHKAALAMKVTASDAVFVSDLESLELIVGDRSAKGVATRLNELSLRAAAADKPPFVAVHSTEELKKVMRSEAAPREGRLLRQAASTVEGQLLDLLEDRCNQEFEAGLALAFSAGAKGVSGVFKKLTAGGRKPPDEVKVKTRLYAQVLRGSGVFLAREDVKRWMEFLAEVGTRYGEALRKERDRCRAAKERGSEPAWDDLLALDDATLLAAVEAALLFRAAFFKGSSIQGVDLRTLASHGTEAIAGAVPARYEPVPLPILNAVYGIFKDVTDVPSNSVDARTLFEFFALVSLMGVTDSTFNEVLRQAQHFGDADEVQAAKSTYGQQLEILRGGLGRMERIIALLKLEPPLRTVAKSRSLFARYSLPLYELLP